MADVWVRVYLHFEEGSEYPGRSWVGDGVEFDIGRRAMIRRRVTTITTTILKRREMRMRNVGSEERSGGSGRRRKRRPQRLLK